MHSPRTPACPSIAPCPILAPMLDSTAGKQQQGLRVLQGPQLLKRLYRGRAAAQAAGACAAKQPGGVRLPDSGSGATRPMRGDSLSLFSVRSDPANQAVRTPQPPNSPSECRPTWRWSHSRSLDRVGANGICNQGRYQGKLGHLSRPNARRVTSDKGVCDRRQSFASRGSLFLLCSSSPHKTLVRGSTTQLPFYTSATPSDKRQHALPPPRRHRPDRQARRLPAALQGPHGRRPGPHRGQPQAAAGPHRRDGLAALQGRHPERPHRGARRPGPSAAIMTLNTVRKSDSPFAPQLSPPRLLADSAANACAALQEAGIRRIVVMSTAGAGDSWGNLPWLTKAFMGWTNIKLAVEDHNLVDKEIRETGLDWTLVRASRLEYEDAKQKTADVQTLDGAGVGMRMTDSVSVTSAAGFLIKAAVEGLFVKKAVVIRD
ncbi:hypothetical protein ACCO45_006258 [Purpureocillium lilacinum]|uniref:Uncharacterized protein n=1 Tax=Purpureocillium lilacinum TaxID=33203 RepID=A0ACC4DXN6_PURLI